MFMNTVLFPYYSSSKGGNIDLLDPHAVQQNFNTINTETISTQTRWQASMTEMNSRVAKLESDFSALNHFMKFCADQRPEVIQAYVATLRAQDRLGVKP